MFLHDPTRLNWGTAGWAPTWVTWSWSTCARHCMRCCRTVWRPTYWTWSSASDGVSPGAWWRPPHSWVRSLVSSWYDLHVCLQAKLQCMIGWTTTGCSWVTYLFVSLRSVHAYPPQPVLKSEPVLWAHKSQHEAQRLHLRPAQVSPWFLLSSTSRNGSFLKVLDR